jgi:shikimate kinase
MADSYTIYDRVKDNTDRPLLQGENPYEKICSLMKQRKPLYESAADVVVDTNSNNLDEVCLQITGEV